MGSSSRAWRVGATIYGVVLGVALALAIAELAVLATGARVFRYQGF